MPNATTLSVNTDVSSLTSDNLKYLNESLSNHARHHQRHSQRHHNNKLNAAAAQAAQASTTTAVISPSAKSTRPLVPSHLNIESSSSTGSSPELSPTPMSNLSSVSSMDDLSEISQKTASTSQTHFSSSSSSLSTIVPLQRTQTEAAQIASTPRSYIDIGSPLLRKKSGELLKSSLRLPDLQRCQSMPNAKSVRFATDLEKVKLFEKSERPIAVSTDNSPISDERVYGKKLTTSWDFDSSSSGSSSSSDSEDEEFLAPKPRQWKVVSSNVRSSFNIDQSKIVQLMRVQLNKTILTGSVFVKNLSFSKRVGIRISIDNWKSIVIIQSSYKRSVNGQFDEFEFELNISSLNFKFYESSLTVNLCVEYEVDGQIYWDNNQSSNYQVVVERITKKSKKSQQQHSRPHHQPHQDYFQSKKKFGLANDQDNDFNYRLKPKNNRYTFDFDHQYTFNDSVLSQPDIHRFDFKNHNSSDDTIILADDPFRSTPISSAHSEHGSSADENRPLHHHRSATFPRRDSRASQSTPDLSTLRSQAVARDDQQQVLPKTSSFNNEDEYHRLIRNYCYAFS